MKRLLKVSFDLALLSFIPVLSWFLLGIIVDGNLINVFTLTYPIQYVYFVLKSIFSTGPNISKEKDKNKDAVMSGLVLGIIVSVIVFSFILVNVEDYINFMNMDVSIYKVFTTYSIISLFYQTIFSFILNKLYYENNNTLANKYSVMFNLLNFVVLILTSLITKNQIIIISVTLVIVGIFIMYILVKSFDKFKYKLDIKKCIKYDSVELFSNLFYLIIFFFGFSNAFQYGEVYASALTFATLVTDTQWDVFDAINTLAKIDISKNKFNYIEHKNNSYMLLGILFSTIILMFFALCWFYDINYMLAIVYLLFDITNFLVYPIYRLKTCYMQIEWSSVKVTTNSTVASVLRMLISFVSSPFCTGFGQVVLSMYKLVTLNFLFSKNYRINESGMIVKK